jgi:hypothetical protein
VTRRLFFYQPVTLLFIIVMLASCGGSTRTTTTSNNAAAKLSLPQPTPAQPMGRLDGGFIQYRTDVLKLPQDKWTQLINAVSKQAEMHVIIIQRLAIPNKPVPDDGVPLPDQDTIGKDTDEKYYEPDASDARNPKDKYATEIILKNADDNGMDVYIGLWDETNFNWAKINEKYLRGVEEKYISLARKVWPLYRRHKSFKGWYLPLEMWNHANSEEKIIALNSFLKRVITRLRADIYDEKKRDTTLTNEKELLAGKEVAMSPYFVPKWRDDQNWLSTADEVQDIYFRTLHETGLNILMLQDGVGARTLRGNEQDNAKWKDLPTYLREVTKYTDAFHQVCNDLSETGPGKVAFWANLESFEPGWISTNVQRLESQFQAQPPGVSKFVTFDFYHYLNPVVPDGYGNGSLAGRKTLYCGYLDRFMKKKCKD